MDAETIEKWISAIESSSAICDKEIENLISLWKFSSCYGNGAEITDDGFLKDPAGNNVRISFTDVALTAVNNPNVLSSLCVNIGTALHELKDSYYIMLHGQKHNFTPGRLLALEEEIISAIQGRLIAYNYVKRLTKVSPHTGIYTNTMVKKCSREDILWAIAQSDEPQSSNDWLVLVLDSLASQCDSFYFDRGILSQPFATAYSKILLFDYYKGEITELATTAR